MSVPPTSVPARRWSIRAKLKLTLMGVSGAAVLAAFGAFVVLDSRVFGGGIIDPERLRPQLLAAALAFLTALLAASLLAARLERLFTRPILHLADTVEAVAAGNDFTRRAVRTTNDETGRLIDGFNTMLTQLQARDATLARIRDGLEERVRERTSLLRRNNDILRQQIERRRAADAELAKREQERSRAETALRQAETRHRRLVESVQAIVWRADARTLRPTYVSPEAGKLLGHPEKLWTESPSFWIDQIHADDRERTLAACRRAAQSGTPVEVVYRTSSADGRTVWLRDIISAVAENGTVTELVGVKVDITRQKLAESAMRESEERYRHLFEGSPDAILIETDGAVVLMNSSAEKLLGASGPEELSESGLLDRVRARLTAGPDASTFEDVWRRQDGRSVDVEVTATPFSHRGHGGCQIVVRDITRRKEAEHLKSEFVSTVSHELRTPLTSIRGTLGLLAAGKAGAISPAAKPLVQVANDDCLRLVRLINDLLDIQKIEAGRMDFRMEPMDVGALLTRSVEASRAYAAPFGVTFALAEPDCGLANGDPDRLQQVVVNLLSNAAKFSPRGGTVDVDVRRLGESFEFSVRDRGPGIPEEFRDRVFQKFAQADSSDGRQKGGTGLGLNICKAIVERHGGDIGFEPVADGGTRFWFSIPASADAAVGAA